LKKVNVDAIVDHVNYHKSASKKRIGRYELGLKLWPEMSRTSIEAKMSYLASGKRKLSETDAIFIVKKLNFPSEKLYLP